MHTYSCGETFWPLFLSSLSKSTCFFPILKSLNFMSFAISSPPFFELKFVHKHVRKKDNARLCDNFWGRLSLSHNRQPSRIRITFVYFWQICARYPIFLVTIIDKFCKLWYSKGVESIKYHCRYGSGAFYLVFVDTGKLYPKYFRKTTHISKVLGKIAF